MKIDGFADRKKERENAKTRSRRYKGERGQKYQKRTVKVAFKRTKFHAFHHLEHAFDAVFFFLFQASLCLSVVENRLV